MAEGQPPTTIFHLTVKLGKLTLKLACSAFAPSETQRELHTKLIGEVRATVDRLENHFASSAKRPQSSTAQDHLPREHGTPADNGIDGIGDVEGIVDSGGLELPNSASAVIAKKRKKLGYKIESSNGRLKRIEEHVELMNDTLSISDTAGAASDAIDGQAASALDTGGDNGLTNEPTPSSSSQQAQERNSRYGFPIQTSIKLPVQDLAPHEVPASSIPRPQTPTPYSERPSAAGNHIIKPEAMLDATVNVGLGVKKGAVASVTPNDDRDSAMSMGELGLSRQRALSDPLIRRN
ncbi:hypothetical protein T440DRAFT_517400 [Plenodomus tracheiphilus IPT5]|uniref:Uncharacterized protein n=1 Tax=Plenodomus tracheiphilus IPT5 TaxID=1408161 RepID=A0A6A7B770_9PLEO|nr:hypothetical protein T440DRAFT_517400 [Plenodomus tracheiphilus IPT5]